MHSAREDKEHPISIPLMNPPANAFQPCIIRVMTRPLVKLPTVCSFFSFFSSWTTARRDLCVFATCSLEHISICNPFPFFPPSPKLHSGFIILSSGSQQGIVQTLQTGSFFTGWLPSYLAGCVTQICDRLTSHQCPCIREEMQCSFRSRALCLFVTSLVCVCEWVCECISCLCPVGKHIFVYTYMSNQIITIVNRHADGTLLITETLIFYLFLFPSRPQFSTSQHHHLRRAQHCHTNRQRIHRHPSSAKWTSCCGDRVH